MEEALLFGALIDVSGSMKDAYALDRSHDASVARTHALLTTIINIVRREVVHHGRDDSIFACAFGLNEDKCGRSCTGIYDLLTLFDLPKDGHQALVDLAVEEGAPHAERWIRNHLSQNEAKIIYTVISRDRSLILELKELLPSETTTNNFDKGATVADKVHLGSVVNAASNVVAKNSEAYKFSLKVVDTFWQQQPRPRPVREITEKLEELLGDLSTTSSQSLHGWIDELIEQIRPYIYGGTPMCKALSSAQTIFKDCKEEQKVLCMISNGMSGDGDPREIAQSLREMDVIIATCFLTSDHIEKPRRLIYEPDPSWRHDDGMSSIIATILHFVGVPSLSGRQVMFEMSSIMKNTHTPISYLVDADWELSLEGESHLFIQSNSLDIVNEFCRLLFSQLSKPCDALVHCLEKVHLADYINVTNAEFMPKQQQGETVYASACAAVLNLAMHRIVGREDGVPSFKELRKKLIATYGEHGKRSEVVLNEVCPEYRLRVRTVDETGARKAINERRPVVARFSLFNEQWKMFKNFYKEKPKGILKKENIEGEGFTDQGAHAVVLTGCSPTHLTFMNSWDQHWADGGFFRVEDANVLSDTEFYDVYWEIDDLTEGEKTAFEREGIEKSRELLQDFPSIKDLSYECPECHESSKVGEYLGHVLEAECPKCHKNFKPTNKEIIESLYTQNHMS